MKRIFFLLLLCITAPATGFAQIHQQPAKQTAEYSPNTLIISYSGKRAKVRLQKAVKHYRATIIYEYKNFSSIAIKLPEGKPLEDAINYFQKIKGVVAVNKDYIYHLD